MHLNEFQALCLETAAYHKGCSAGGTAPWVYCAMGLGGEAGEVLNKCKKVIRDDNGLLMNSAPIAQEIGDVLWYAAMLAKEIGWSLDEVAEAVLEKLAQRKANGTISGSGDSR